METIRKIKKAIIKLQVIQPFFAYIAMNLKIKEFPVKGYFTMGVDANWNMYYDEKFVEERLKTSQLLIWAVCHETLHVALNHIGRIGSKHRNIANIAQDMVVNMICEKNGIIGLKVKGFIIVYPDSDTARLDIDNLGMNIMIKNVSEKSWERIYNEIIKQIKDAGKSPSEMEKEMQGFDDHMHESFEKLSKEEQNQVIENAKGIITDAYAYSKQAGKVPGGIDRYVTELLEPKIPWQTKLIRYVKENTDPNDLTYRKPHKKSYQLGVYLPIMKRENISIEVLIDTSGSIDQKSYNEFITELYNMLRVMPNVKVYVSFIDTKVRAEYELRGSDIDTLMKMKPKGGGGTDLETGLEYIKDKKRNCPVTIILTDGYTPCHKKAIDFPFEVVWCICDQGLPIKDASKYLKYGEILHL